MQYFIKRTDWQKGKATNNENERTFFAMLGFGTKPSFHFSFQLRAGKSTEMVL